MIPSEQHQVRGYTTYVGAQCVRRVWCASRVCVAVCSDYVCRAVCVAVSSHYVCRAVCVAVSSQYVRRVVCVAVFSDYACVCCYAFRKFPLC